MTIFFHLCHGSLSSFKINPLCFSRLLNQVLLLFYRYFQVFCMHVGLGSGALVVMLRSFQWLCWSVMAHVNGLFWNWILSFHVRQWTDITLNSNYKESTALRHIFYSLAHPSPVNMYRKIHE